MEYLRDSAVLDRDAGYSINYRVGWWDPDDNIVTSFLFGNLFRFFAPLVSRLGGNRQNRKFQRILADYPHTLICTHCEHIIKRK